MVLSVHYTEHWQKLYGEHHICIVNPVFIIQIIRLMKIRWVGKVACMGYISEDLKGTGHLEDVSIIWRVILKHLEEMGSWDMDWIHVAQDSGKRQAFVNMVRNLKVS